MDRSKIQDIITKSILEEASSEELVILENWRRESAQNEDLYQEYATIWNTSSNYAPTIDFQPKAITAYEKHLDLLKKEENKVVQINSTAKNTEQPSTSNSTIRIFTLRRLASVAALFVLVFGASIVFNSMSNTSMTAEEGVMFVSLEDGTSIWLDKGSTLTYKNGFSKEHRDVKLKGKAFFDVERNESVAFNITTGDLDVSVLGTSFTVDAKDKNNVVSVKSGKVSVKANDKQVILTADQKAVFENNKFSQVAVSQSDMAWRNSSLSFDNAPLSQVIADINLFHDDKIIINNDIKNLNCPFTMRSMAKTSFENIIEVLKITYDLEVENEVDGSISLTIKECK